MTTHNSTHLESGENEHPDLVASLRELGERDRGLAPANLTDRLVMRTQSNLMGRADTPDGTPIVVVRTLKWGGRWGRIAAGVLILASTAVVILSLPKANQPVPPVLSPIVQASAEFNLDLVDGSFWDDSIDGQIAVLMAESTMLDGELDREWSDLDFLSDEGAL